MIKSKIRGALFEEDDVTEWFMSNPMLYNKGHADYKLAAKRTRMWEEKAQELGKCDGEYKYNLLYSILYFKFTLSVKLCFKWCTI